MSKHTCTLGIHLLTTLVTTFTDMMFTVRPKITVFPFPCQEKTALLINK